MTGLWNAWKRIRNHRLYRRIDVENDVTLRVHPSGKSSHEKITNWSPGGVFVKTAQPAPVGTEITLEFSLSPTGGSLLKLSGQVVRHATNGMGIMFTDFTQDGLQVLRDLLFKSFPN